MKSRAISLAFLCLAAAAAQAQVVLGQTDTFSANIQGWQGAAPSWVSTGGPGGSGDGFLQLASTGTGGPGGKMAGYNPSQWSGNYVSAGIGVIGADFKNLGATNLEMRLVFFDTTTSTQWVSNDSLVIAAGSSWIHKDFVLSSSLFTQTEGTTSFVDTLSGANRMMFRHDPGAPGNSGTNIVATLGIDNVHAGPVPEPFSICTLGIGIAAMLRRRRK